MCSKNAVHVCNICVSYSLLPLFNLLAGLVDLRAGAAISFGAACSARQFQFVVHFTVSFQAFGRPHAFK